MKSKSAFDVFGDRQKLFEGREAGRLLMPGLPVLARLDGRAFKTFTKGLQRPYEAALSRLMVDTATYLVEQTHCAVAYTQSDEITLAWNAVENPAEFLFKGRVQKLTSILAAMATSYFTRAVPERLPSKAHLHPLFDARVWQVPNLEVALECFQWREADATKNAVTMAARAYYSDKDLFQVGTALKHDMLMAKGVNFNDYPAFFKRGTYVRRETVERELSAAEIGRIPEGRRPSGPVARQKIVEMELPPIFKVINAVNVLFHKAEPLTAASG
jgi:tRNA(His) guanylyltransferase